jgi:hypothetical protein
MKRILGLLFLSSSAFIVQPVAAQEGSGGGASADASVPADPTDAAPEGSGGGKGSGGGTSGGGKGSGGVVPLEPIGAEPREYDLLENDGKACSVASVARSRGDGAAFLIASAAAAMATRRRRAGRRT